MSKSLLELIILIIFILGTGGTALAIFLKEKKAVIHFFVSLIFASGVLTALLIISGSKLESAEWAREKYKPRLIKTIEYSNASPIVIAHGDGYSSITFINTKGEEETIRVMKNCHEYVSGSESKIELYEIIEHRKALLLYEEKESKYYKIYLPGEPEKGKE